MNPGQINFDYRPVDRDLLNRMNAPVRRYLTPLIVLIFGLLSIALLISLLGRSREHTAQEFLVDNVLTQVETATAISHLWLEEYLSGDPSIDFKNISMDLDESIGLVQLVLRGGEINPGDAIEPLRDPELRQRAESLHTQLVEFKNLSVDRAYRGGEAEAGTEIDQSYDQVFHDLLHQSATLRKDLETLWGNQQEQTHITVRTVIGAWSLVVLLTVFALWNHERRRQRMDEALHTSQNWLATTLNSIGDGVITTDLRGRVTFLNPVAERLTAWTLSEASGQQIEDIFKVVDEQGDHPVENPLLRVLRHGSREQLSNHTVLTARDGERFYINHSAAPIASDPNTLLGAVLVFRDISQRKKAQKALLERETELREAQKMEAVGRLAGGLAHDINNYLGAIRGYCEVAKMKRESGPALVKRMDNAIDTIESISSLVRQLLAFSRRQPVEPEIVDLNQVVSGMEDLMQGLIGEQVVLNTELEADMAPVLIDPSQVEQVLVNLLVNAGDAMPKGGYLRVKTFIQSLSHYENALGGEPLDGVFACLQVSDSGVGIAPEIREKIFEPFFSTKSSQDRSGLGLATVYGIVTQNGGSIEVESELGVGTTFKIFLPAHQHPALATPSPQIAESSAQPKKRIEVLLVEDNAAMRHATWELLEALGHDVRVAADGYEAIRLLETGKQPDLLITDVIMPGLSGTDLVERARIHYPDLRFLFISGYANQALKPHGLNQQQIDFLAKPFAAESLEHKIDEILSA